MGYFSSFFRCTNGHCVCFPSHSTVTPPTHTGQKQAIQRCHPYSSMQENTRKVPEVHLTIIAVLSRVQLTLHATRSTPHGASCLAQAMSAWSVKTRRAPPRHCRDARVYDDTTTGIHGNEYTPQHARASPRSRSIKKAALLYSHCYRQLQRLSHSTISVLLLLSCPAPSTHVSPRTIRCRQTCHS